MLKNVKNLVTNILTTDTESRNSDRRLYFLVCQNVAENEGIDLAHMNVKQFLLGSNDFPSFETVRRTRQKVQEHSAELGACKTVKAYRAELENEYREFARKG